MQEHKLVLIKLAERQLQLPKIDKQIDTILSSKSVNNRSLKNAGWTVVSDPIGHGDREDWRRDRYEPDRAWQQNQVVNNGSNYRYEMFLKVVFDEEPGQKEGQYFRAICRAINTTAAQPVAGRWALSTVDGDEFVQPDDATVPMSKDFMGYTTIEIPSDFEDNFSHLYGLDYHITIIKKAVAIGMDSDWSLRYHCALIGPPGCGKSDICQTLKKMWGEESVLEFDATAMTAAGAIQELAHAEILPRVIVIEEIEKADEKSLNFLLAVLDMRAEIRKITARASIQRDTKLFGIATVNNEDLFNKVASGALASRFANQIHFNRPTREQLRMILQREILKLPDSGDLAWADPALDYCDEHGITDPRKVTAICLCGRDDLITGEYQKMLEATSRYQPSDLYEEPVAQESESWDDFQ